MIWNLLNLLLWWELVWGASKKNGKEKKEIVHELNNEGKKKEGHERPELKGKTAEELSVKLSGLFHRNCVLPFDHALEINNQLYELADSLKWKEVASVLQPTQLDRLGVTLTKLAIDTVDPGEQTELLEWLNNCVTAFEPLVEGKAAFKQMALQYLGRLDVLKRAAEAYRRYLLALAEGGTFDEAFAMLDLLLVRKEDEGERQAVQRFGKIEAQNPQIRFKIRKFVLRKMRNVLKAGEFNWDDPQVAQLAQIVEECDAKGGICRAADLIALRELKIVNGKRRRLFAQILTVLQDDISSEILRDLATKLPQLILYGEQPDFESLLRVNELLWDIAGKLDGEMGKVFWPVQLDKLGEAIGCWALENDADPGVHAPLVTQLWGLYERLKEAITPNPNPVSSQDNVQFLGRLDVFKRAIAAYQKYKDAKLNYGSAYADLLAVFPINYDAQAHGELEIMSRAKSQTPEHLVKIRKMVIGKLYRVLSGGFFKWNNEAVDQLAATLQQFGTKGGSRDLSALRKTMAGLTGLTKELFEQASVVLQDDLG